MKRATTKAVIAAFGERLSDEGLALGTIRDYQRCIRFWAKWLSSRSTSLRRAKPEDLRALLFSLESAYVASKRGEGLPPGIPPWIQPLQWQSRAKLLAAIYRLNDYLVDEFPGVKRFRRQVFFARSRRRIPRVLSEFEIEQLLNQPNTGTVLGLRDRALLELMYAAGLRASEVASLELGQLDLYHGTATVDGKGARQRMVIFGESARDWCRRYLREARPLLANGSRRKLFLNRFGRPLTRDGIHYAVSKHAREARLSHVSPHTLRHTFATHLVAGGADIVAVQQLLGHAMIDTTEIYTHVSNVRLAMLHAIHHPR